MHSQEEGHTDVSPLPHCFHHSYTVLGLCLGNGATHEGLGLPMPINNQDNSLQTRPQAN